MINVAWEKDNCPYCVRTKLAIILHNATHSPEDWIEIVDIDMGDPTIRIIENVMGMAGEKVSEQGYLPTVLTKGVFHNFVRDKWHYYHFLKKLFERR